MDGLCCVLEEGPMLRTGAPVSNTAYIIVHNVAGCSRWLTLLIALVCRQPATEAVATV